MCLLSRSPGTLDLGVIDRTVERFAQLKASVLASGEVGSRHRGMNLESCTSAPWNGFSLTSSWLQGVCQQHPGSRAFRVKSRSKEENLPY